MTRVVSVRQENLFVCVCVCVMVLVRVWKVLASASLASTALAGTLSFCRNESHYPGLSQDFTGITVIKKEKENGRLL